MNHYARIPAKNMSMLRCMLRAKLHGATITGAEIEYEGSITIDESIIEQAGILPFEQVMVSNLNNGERFETYVIPGKRNSGEMCLNGPTARKGVRGDSVMVFSFGYVQENDLEGFRPKILILDAHNKVFSVK